MIGKYKLLWLTSYVNKTRFKLCFFYFFSPKSFEISKYIYHFARIIGHFYGLKYDHEISNILFNLSTVACATSVGKIHI